MLGDTKKAYTCGRMPLAALADRLAPGLPRPMQIPLVMYLMTHAYFCFYHALSNVLLRRVRRSC